MAGSAWRVSPGMPAAESVLRLRPLRCCGHKFGQLGRGWQDGDIGDGHPPGAGDFLWLWGEVAAEGTAHVHEVDVAVGADLGVGNVHLDDRPWGGVAAYCRMGERGLADSRG